MLAVPPTRESQLVILSHGPGRVLLPGYLADRHAQTVYTRPYFSPLSQEKQAWERGCLIKKFIPIYTVCFKIKFPLRSRLTTVQRCGPYSLTSVLIMLDFIKNWRGIQTLTKPCFLSLKTLYSHDISLEYKAQEDLISQVNRKQVLSTQLRIVKTGAI